MFVDITTPKKPLEVERIYNKCYRGGEEITPEVCMEVLRSTNYAACVRRMLLCVEKLPVEKQGACKEVVLAVFDRREQPEEVKEIGERLARASGYIKELDAVKKSVYNSNSLKSAPNRLENKVFHGKGYYQHNFSEDGVAGAVFSAPEVDLTDAKNLPETVDLSQADMVHLNCADLKGVKSLTFKEGAGVNLTAAAPLPESLDVSGLSHVGLSECDLTGIRLCFSKGASVDLRGTKGLPEVLDVSSCGNVDMRWGDFAGAKKIVFKDEEQMNASRIKLSENSPVTIAYKEKTVFKKMWHKFKGQGRQ